MSKELYRYIDECGTPDLTSSDHFGIGGLLVEGAIGNLSLVST